MSNYKVSLTDAHSTFRIMAFLDAPNKFIGIGKPTPWYINETKVPDVESNSLIQEPICYIKPYLVAGAYQSICGLVTVNGFNWTLVDRKDIRVEHSRLAPACTHLYIEVRINPDYYNTDSFRCIGLFSHTEILSSANPNLLVYEPSMISNPGVLHWVAYSNPIYRLENKSHILNLMIPL